MEFPTHKELQSMWAEQKRDGEAARLMADDGVTPEAGHFYAVSKDFSRGDGSWVDNFWEVLSINGPKAFVRIHVGYGEPLERFFDVSDRAWYLADDAWKSRTVKA